LYKLIFLKHLLIAKCITVCFDNDLPDESDMSVMAWLVTGQLVLRRQALPCVRRRRKCAREKKKEKTEN
jgi:hypothetical protein